MQRGGSDDPYHPIIIIFSTGLSYEAVGMMEEDWLVQRSAVVLLLVCLLLLPFNLGKVEVVVGVGEGPSSIMTTVNKQYKVVGIKKKESLPYGG